MIRIEWSFDNNNYHIFRENVDSRHMLASLHEDIVLLLADSPDEDEEIRKDILLDLQQNLTDREIKNTLQLILWHARKFLV